MDFEQALMHNGTVQLREGIDMNQLGEVDMSMESSASIATYSSLAPPQSAGASKNQGGIRPLPSTPGASRKASGVNQILATPTVVPPTPKVDASFAVNQGSSMGKGSTVKGGGSPSSSSQELFYDADDGASSRTATSSGNASANNLSTSTATPLGNNMNAGAGSNNSTNLTTSSNNTNRRSLYRSPGTSSSPDLATLLRKAKEKGDTAGIQKLRKEHPHSGRAKQEVPPMPERESRPRSSTTSGPSSSTPSSPATVKTVGRMDATLGIKGGKESGTKVRFLRLVRHVHVDVDKRDPVQVFRP